MGGILILLAVLLIAGLPAALLFDVRRSAGRLAGEAFLLGCGVVSFVLLGLSVSGTPWTKLSVGISLCAVVGVLAFLAAFRGRGLQFDPPTGASSLAGRMASAVLDIATAALVVSHALIATLASIPAIDFWAIWGLKGRVFFEHRGIDWRFLEDAGNAFAHTGYPPLVSLNYAFASILRGGWEDRWIGLLSTAFAAAAILIVRDLIGRETGSRWMAALGANILAPLALSRWVGTAEPAMIAYSAAGLLLIRRGLREDSFREIGLGAIFLGLAIQTKNEGITLLIAAALGIAMNERRGWRKVVRLWPAAVIAAPWLILKERHDLATYLTSGPLLERALGGLGRIGTVGEQLMLNAPSQQLFWAAALITVLIVGSAPRREKFLILTLGTQLFFFVVAYVITPLDVAWHVANSWTRILEQLALPLGFLALLLILEQLRRPDSSTKIAEA